MSMPILETFHCLRTPTPRKVPETETLLTTLYTLLASLVGVQLWSLRAWRELALL